MLNMSTRYDLRTAAQKAHELFDLLRPACDAMEVAGSIRRRAATVKDIELVVVPLAAHFESLFDAELPLGDPFEEHTNRLDLLVERLIAEGVLEWDRELRPRRPAVSRNTAFGGADRGSVFQRDRTELQAA